MTHPQRPVLNLLRTLRTPTGVRRAFTSLEAANSSRICYIARFKNHFFNFLFARNYFIDYFGAILTQKGNSDLSPGPAAGLVAHLNRPGGNVTGVTIMGLEMGPKRIELAHQLVPSGSALATLINSKFPPTLADARDASSGALSWFATHYV
jgi:hypothetical protein